jgi:hypothetical protein
MTTFASARDRNHSKLRHSSELAVETLRRAILPGLTEIDQRRVDAHARNPGEQGARYELGAALKSHISGMHIDRRHAHFFPHIIPRRIAVANVPRVDARKNAKVATAGQSADSDWWSWALIATIFAISATSVWVPIIVGAI